MKAVAARLGSFAFTRRWRSKVVRLSSCQVVGNTMTTGEPDHQTTLSVIALGHVHTEAIEPLTSHLTRLEQVVTNLGPQVSLADSRAEINRAIDAAAHDWILI